MGETGTLQICTHLEKGNLLSKETKHLVLDFTWQFSGVLDAVYSGSDRKNSEGRGGRRGSIARLGKRASWCRLTVVKVDDVVEVGGRVGCWCSVGCGSGAGSGSFT